LIAVKAEIFHETTEGCIVRVLVRPNAKKSGVTAVSAEALEVSLRSPPLKNKANLELVEILSSVFSVPKSEIQIISGLQSREKFLTVSRQKTFLEQKIAALQN
jgi:uncharacterized protein (TIGR00251 family)